MEKIIKVVNIQRKILNLATITDEELDLNFLQFKQYLNGFKEILHRIQSPSFQLLTLDIENIKDSQNVLLPIILRNLLSDESLIPIITFRGKEADAFENSKDLKDSKNLVRTKLNRRSDVISSLSRRQLSNNIINDTNLNIINDTNNDTNDNIINDTNDNIINDTNNDNLKHLLNSNINQYDNIDFENAFDDDNNSIYDDNVFGGIDNIDSIDFINNKNTLKSSHKRGMVSDEESIIISAIYFDKDYQGLSLLHEYIPPSANIGINAFIESGNFTPQLVTLLYDVKPFPINVINSIDLYTQIIQKVKKTTEYYLSACSLLAVANYLLLKFKKNEKNKNILLDSMVKKTNIEYKTWRLSKDLDKIKKVISENKELHYLKNPNIYIYDLTILFEFYQIHGLNILYNILIENEQAIQKFLLLKSSNELKIQQMNQINKKIIENKILSKQYMIIIEEKFGILKLNNILTNLKKYTKFSNSPGGTLAKISDIIQIDDPFILLKFLSKSEKEIVETTYLNKLEIWKASIQNKCPHILLYRKLRAAKTKESTYYLFKKVMEYADKNYQEKNYIMCKNCKFSLICPHIADKLNAEIKYSKKNIDNSLSSSEIKYDELINIYNKYIIKAESNNIIGSNNYYCNICSEKLIETDTDTVILDSKYGNLNDGIRSKIWGITIQAVKYVTFDIPIDDKIFANNATNILYEFISGLNIIKTTVTYTDDPDVELDPLIYLYCIIFVYAYILHIINTSNQKIGFQNVKITAKLATYAEEMIKLFTNMSSTYSLMAQLSLNIDFISQKFISAYRSIKGLSGFEQLVKNPEMELIYQISTVDPAYKYAKFVYDVIYHNHEKATFKDIVGVSPEAAIERAKKASVEKSIYVGKNYEFLIKKPLTNFYIKLFMPDFSNSIENDIKSFYTNSDWNFINYKSTNFKSMTLVNKLTKKGGKKDGKKDGKLIKIKKDDKLIKIKKDDKLIKIKKDNKYQNIFNGYFYESYRLFHLYTTKITSQVEYNNYIQELESFRKKENYINLIRLISGIKAYYNIANKDIANKDIANKDIANKDIFKYNKKASTNNISITELYDEEGLRHKWDIYCYENGEDLTINQIDENINTNFINLYKSDANAIAANKSDANANKSDANANKSNANVNKNKNKNKSDAYAMAEMAAINVLIDVKCSVCGIKKSKCKVLDEEKTKKALKINSEIGSFFTFYQSRCPLKDLHIWKNGSCTKCNINVNFFTNLLSKESKEFYKKYNINFINDKFIIENNNKIVIKNKVIENKIIVKSINLLNKPDYSIIIKLAKFAKTTVSAIESIGCTEQLKYEQIKNDKIKIPILDINIFSTVAEVRYFLVIYSCLKNIHKIPHIELLLILQKSDVPKHEYVNLKEILPEIGTDFYQLLKQIEDESNEQKHKFIIQKLGEYILTLASFSNSNSKDINWISLLCVNFSKFIINTILLNQKLLSTPMAFNWAIFTNDADDDILDQVGDVGEDIEMPPDEDLIYSGENLDYDISEDNPNNEYE